MKLKGRNLIVFWRNSNTEDFTTLAYATQCELEVSADTVEVASPDTGAWKTYKKKRKGWEVTEAKLMSKLSEADLIAKVESNSTVEVMVASVSDVRQGREAGDYAPDLRFGKVGTAIVTRCTITGNNGDFVNVSMQLLGSGELRDIMDTGYYDSPFCAGFLEASAVGDIDLPSLDYRYTRTAVGGSYSWSNPVRGYYLWVCVPTAYTQPSGFSSSGFTVPMTTYTRTIDGTAYTCYRSDARIIAGLHKITLTT